MTGGPPKASGASYENYGDRLNLPKNLDQNYQAAARAYNT